MTVETSSSRTARSSPRPVGTKRTRKQSKITDAFSAGRPVRADGRASLKEQTLNEETASPLSPKQLVKRQRPVREANSKNEENPIQEAKMGKEQLERVVEFKQDKLEVKSRIEPESLKNKSRPVTEPAYKKYAHLLEESPIPLPTTPSPTTSKLMPSPCKTSSPCKTTPFKESPSSLAIVDDIKSSQNAKAKVSDSLKASIVDSAVLATSSASLLIKDSLISAHQRFTHLVSSTSTKLPLPAKFILLDRILGAIDSLLMIAMGRGQPVIFHRAIPTLETTVGRRIEERHIKQLVGILSESDNQETFPFNFRRVKTVIEGRRVDSFAMELPEHPTHEFLAHRRDTLHLRLQECTRNCHQRFLESIKYVLPPGAILRAWHPDFDLEGVTDLEEPELFPKAPLDTITIPQEIQAVLPINPESLTTNPADDLAKATATASSVLERIRTKQRAAELASITLLPTDASKHQQQALLDLSSRLALLFQSTPKSTLPLSEVVDKLVSGSRLARSPTEIVALIDELAQRVSGWISIVKPTNSKEVSGLGDRMVRINRSVTLIMAQKQLQL